VVGAVEDRRSAAKELLLQIQTDMGSEAMEQIAQAVRSLHRRPIDDLKDRAVEILQGQPDLLEKFLRFLPRRFRVI